MVRHHYRPHNKTCIIKTNNMNTDNKKGNAIVVLIIILAVVGGGLILAKSSFLPGQDREAVKPSLLASPTNNPIVTPTPSPTLTPSSTPKDTTITEITGIFNLVYGDPQPGSGSQQPRYKYSLTDDLGKTTQIKIDSNTKLVGGQSIIDFNRKRVKVKGSLEDPKTLITASIEIL